MHMLRSLGINIPIVQAPMAGVSTPVMAAAVSNAGGLGSIAVGATNVAGARAMIAETRSRTDQPFNVNLFVHDEPQADERREQDWLNALGPLFEAYGAKPPAKLQKIYNSFAVDDEMLAMLLEVRPKVVSFHFGVPDAVRITALRQAGCLLMASATNVTEAQAINNVGIDMVIAQGWEAGGHRGVFDPSAQDQQLGTLALTHLLVQQSRMPVVAAGGIMDGAGINAVLGLGAVAAQLGTAFVTCPESSADEAYRTAMQRAGTTPTVMTSAISGRPARCLANAFTNWAARATNQSPDYPLAYDAGKALNAAAKALGESGYGAQWAGQGAPRCRPMGAADLLKVLWQEVMSATAFNADKTG